jgi:hypothetical protein
LIKRSLGFCELIDLFFHELIMEQNAAAVVLFVYPARR